MFTGIVEGRGTVSQIWSEGTAVRLTIRVPKQFLGEVAGGEVERTGQFPSEREQSGQNTIGDSVAINGCCLTLVEIDGRLWSFQAGAETLAKTNLGDIKAGDPVNIERSLPVDGRLGGHFVQGHVDGIGTVHKIETDGEWVTMWFRVPEELAGQMVAKGSIAIDGVSLTLVDVEADRFSVALIPHTLDVTTLGVRSIGTSVNIETDIFGKYVMKFMGRAKSDELGT